METQITKVKILIWLVIALAILNIATILTIFYHGKQIKHRYFLSRGMSMHVQPHEFQGYFLINKLNFNKEQLEQFHKINYYFKNSSVEIAGQMNDNRLGIINELKKGKTDTIELFNYARKIGDLHYKLKKNLAIYLLELKNICTPSQKDTLLQVLSNLNTKEQEIFVNNSFLHRNIEGSRRTRFKNR